MWRVGDDWARIQEYARARRARMPGVMAFLGLHRKVLVPDGDRCLWAGIDGTTYQTCSSSGFGSDPDVDQRFCTTEVAQGSACRNVDLRFKHKHPSRWHEDGPPEPQGM